MLCYLTRDDNVALRRFVHHGLGFPVTLCGSAFVNIKAFCFILSVLLSLSSMLSLLICVMLANCPFGLYIRTEFHWASIIS